MDSKCLGSTQMSDLDQMVMPPDVLWGGLPTYPASGSHLTRFAKPKSDAEERSPSLWLRSRSPSIAGQYPESSPHVQDESPTSATIESQSGGGSLESSLEPGVETTRLRTTSAHIVNTCTSSQEDCSSHVWPRMGDFSVCENCDDVRATSGVSPSSDWYRYHSPALARYQDCSQRFRTGQSQVDCQGIGYPSPGSYAQSQQRNPSAQKPPATLQPLYMRMKPQHFQQHFHPHAAQGSEQSHGLYGDRVYTPIYTISSDSSVPHTQMQHPQVEYATQQPTQSQMFPQSWKRAVTGNQGKIFTCQQRGCGKSFKRAEHLNRHRRMHTGERPFACNEPGCDRKFSRTDNLAAHKKIHRKVKSDFVTNAQLTTQKQNIPDQKEQRQDPEGSPAQSAGAERSLIQETPQQISRPECSASDAESDESSASEKSPVQEMSPMSQQQSFAILQSAREVHSIQPSHIQSIPRYQKPQQGIHHPLY